MKKTLVLIVSSITIAILLFVVFTKADYSTLTENEALTIGEEKYLEFLWMIDGAFNSEKVNSEFTVNGKMLDKDNKKFTCTYKNKKDNSCVGENFESEFKRLFASNITYNSVYGDGAFYTWIEHKNGKYIFNYINNCSISRMNLDQSIKLEDMNNKSLTFYVTIKDANYKKTKTRLFVLVNEDNEWKISRAYYRDICEMDYYIE